MNDQKPIEEIIDLEIDGMVRSLSDKVKKTNSKGVIVGGPVSN